MSDLLPARVEQVAADGGGFLFLSAHLDDAVLSCGALIGALAGQAPVAVVTVFSAAGPPPHTRAAQAFLRQCAWPTAADLYAARRREDAEVLAGLGVEHVHLGVPDALFRPRAWPPALAGLGRAVPELVHRYPTFRLDIARGRVSRGDGSLVDAVDARVRAVAGRIGAGLVFAPVGVGNHVDHLLTRTVGERYPERVVHYSDFPYDRWASPDAGYLARHRLRPVPWEEGVAGKPALIRGYRTQAAALFPSGDIPVAPETYYLTADRTWGSASCALSRPTDVSTGKISGRRASPGSTSPD